MIDTKRHSTTPSLKAVGLITLMRMIVKPSLATMQHVEELRSGAARWFGRISAPDPDTTVKAAPLSQCDADWVYPRNIETDRVLLYLPGGAFVVRTPDLHRGLVGRVAKAAHARARIVFYRLAPEHPFPAGLDDCLESYEELLAGGIPPARIVIGGDSAGGCLVISMLQSLRDRHRPLPAAAFAISPVTDLRKHTRGSRSRNEERDPMLSSINRNRLNLQGLYVAGKEELLQDPRVSPLLGDFRGLPPLFFQVGSTEILLDDSRLAVDKALAAGTKATVEIWANMPHVWHMWRLPESRRAIAHLADFIREHCP